MILKCAVESTPAGTRRASGKYSARLASRAEPRHQRIEELAWHAAPARVAELDVRLIGAVEIAPARAHESIPLGDVHHLVDERFAVIGVNALDAVQAHVDEVLDGGLELCVVGLAELSWMR